MPENDDIELLQQLIGHGGEQAFRLVPLALQKVIVEKQWRHRLDKNGDPFIGFEAFVTHRLWQGLETTIDDLRVYCRKELEVQKLILQEMESSRESRGSTKDERANRHNNVMSTSRQGNSVLYTLKRLKRDRPDLFDQVIGGMMSANAAAIEAGWRKKQTPLELLQKAWIKANEAERAAFRATICSNGPPD